MASIIDKIKKFFGIPTKELLGEGNKDGDGNGNNNNELSENTRKDDFLKGLTSYAQGKKEIENALNRYLELKEENIELNGKDRKTYIELMEMLEIPSRNGLRELVMGDISGTITTIIDEIYDKDPNILNADRREELIEKIMNTEVKTKIGGPTRIDKTEEEILYYETTFRKAAIDKLYVFSVLGKNNKIISKGFDIRKIIEEKMPVEEFLQTMIENEIDAFMNKLKNASVYGEKYGIQYAMVQATSDDIQIPEEIAEQGVKDVKDYKEKAGDSFLAEIYSLLDLGMPEEVALKAKKFINNCIGQGEGLEESSLEELKNNLKNAFEQDRREGKSDSIRRSTYEIAMRCVEGFLKGKGEYISEGNKQCTKFFDFKNDEKGNEGYVIYEGTPKTPKTPKKPEIDSEQELI